LRSDRGGQLRKDVLCDDLSENKETTAAKKPPSAKGVEIEEASSKTLSMPLSFHIGGYGGVSHDGRGRDTGCPALRTNPGV